jgi:hypothetical protein
MEMRTAPLPLLASMQTLINHLFIRDAVRRSHADMIAVQTANIVVAVGCAASY